MEQALPLCVRERIVKLQSEGFLLTEIKKELSLPYSTVQQIMKRYRTKGLSGLQADYAKCGGKGQLRNLYFYYRVSLWLKRLISKRLKKSLKPSWQNNFQLVIK